nr:uncharacterized protein LOC124808789 [Hydra vulgaris]
MPVETTNTEFLNNSHASDDVLPTYRSLAIEILNDPPPNYRDLPNIPAAPPIELIVKKLSSNSRNTTHPNTRKCNKDLLKKLSALMMLLVILSVVITLLTNYIKM